MPTETSGVRLASLMGAPDAPPVVKTSRGVSHESSPQKPASRRRRPQRRNSTRVEAIRAAKRSEEVVKLEDVK